MSVPVTSPAELANQVRDGLPQPQGLDGRACECASCVEVTARLAALSVLEARLEQAERALEEIDAEIARMDDVWQQHSNVDDYPRILQADAHLNGLKFARAALARGVVGKTSGTKDTA